MGKGKDDQELEAGVVRYVYRPGASPVPGRSADDVGQELERIEKQRGELTASAIVDESAPPEAVLHPAFEWDDCKAARQFRLAQARRIPRILMVQTDVAEKQRPAFVHVEVSRARSENESRREGAYVAIDELVASPALFSAACSEAARRLASAERALRELHEAAAVSADQDRLAMILVAMRAIETASDAVRQLH